MEQLHKKRVTFLITIVIAILFTSYIYYQSRAFFLGPRIIISEPRLQSSTVTEERFTVSGTAENISSLTLNGTAISINQQNGFNETLLLAPGFNIIEVTATDRFDHVETQTRFVVYKPTASPEEIATTTTQQGSEQTSTSTSNSL